MLRTLQTNMTGGAVSADAKDRLDLAVWRNSVRRAENVAIHAQGGASRRNGMAFVAGLTGSLSYQIEAFVFSQNQSYVFLFSSGRVDIYDRVTRAGVYTITGQPWTEAMVFNNELVVVQSFDTMFIFHKDFESQQITRTGATTFAISNIQWGFLDTGGGSVPRMPMHKYISGNVSLTASIVGPGAATVFCGAAMFAPAHVGTWLQMEKIMMFITGFIAGNQLTVSIAGTLPNVGPTLDWQEQAFSAVRGWPRCATLHEQRLWIGGGRSAPNTIFGSTTYDPLNFWLGDGEPTDAIKFVAAQDRVAEIKRMVSFRHLQVYTADAEMFAPSPQNGALTPANFSLRQQSAYGISNSPALRFDQTSIFISRTANSIREFVYDDIQQSYSADALSFMAKDYIRNPVDLNVAIETQTAQEALALVTNGDATLAVLSKVRKENVGGWSLWRTVGPNPGIKSCGVIEREIWAVCAHNNPTECLLEVFDRNYHMDFAVKRSTGSVATSQSWGPFPNHAGTTVDAISGDLYLGRFTVDGAGMIDTGVQTTEIEIGYSFVPLIEPLVQEVQMPDGSSWGLPRRNVSVTVGVVDTLSVRINDCDLPTSNATEDPGVAPDRYTGKFRTWLLGAGVELAPVITSPLPLPFNLTTIMTEVEI